MLFALLAGMFLATPAPAEVSPLAQLPAGAPIVLQIHGVARTRERLQTMLKNALPEVAAQIDSKIEAKLNAELKGRKLQGLAPGGPDFVVVTALPEPAEKSMPPIAYLARVTNYADFRDGLLAPQERKSLTTSPHGYEVATLESGEKLYWIHRQDYAVFTSQKEVAEQFAKGQPALQLNRELTTKLLRPDVALYVDVAAINAKYGDKIKSCRQLAEHWFGPTSPWMKAQTKTNVEFLQALIGTAFQAQADSRAAVFGVEFRPHGLAVSGQADVGANTPTDRHLKNLALSPGNELTSLPAGQMGYWTMVLSPEALKESAWLRSMVLSAGAGAKAVQEAFDELVASGPLSVQGDFSIPVRGLKIYQCHDPAKAANAMLKMFEAFEASDTFQDAPIRGKPQITRNAQNYRGFQLHSVRMKWDFDKLLARYAGPEKDREHFRAAMQQLMGEGIQIWFGTNGKIDVQVTAQDWPGAQRQLDRYLDGQDTLGQWSAYVEVRKELPSEATLIALLDVRRYVNHVIEPFLLPYLKEHAGGAAAAAPRSADEHWNYLGLAVQLQAERIGFEFWLPGTAAQELYRAYEPLFRK
jgi:hypothetical protein